MNRKSKIITASPTPMPIPTVVDLLGPEFGAVDPWPSAGTGGANKVLDELL